MLVSIVLTGTLSDLAAQFRMHLFRSIERQKGDDRLLGPGGKILVRRLAQQHAHMQIRNDEAVKTAIRLFGVIETQVAGTATRLDQSTGAAVDLATAAFQQQIAKLA